MEFKKKTIIWEDNNEPPKNYIWVKSDGKAYEFSHKSNTWEESESIKELNAVETPEDPTEPTTEPVEDTSYQYLLRNGRAPKYFWLYNTDNIEKEIFDSDIIIGGDHASPSGTRLVVDFAKLANLGLLSRFVRECHIGSIGFGMIYEKEENFELTEGDVKGVQISSSSGKLQVTINYFNDTFVFDSSKLYETEINGVVYYEYES